jgi:phosphomannomutase / phosphoglucomutase
MSVFREYDVRGIADRDLLDPLVFSLGRALARRALSVGEKNIFVGQDVRISSERLATTLSAGLLFEGLEVRRLAQGPTPLLYFSAKVQEKDFPTSSGIMVTGSHNPPEYNGFKMVVGGDTLHGSEIQELQKEVAPLLTSFAPEHLQKARKLKFTTSARENEYIEFTRNNIRRGRKLKIVIDGGNGAGGPLALATYQALGHEVIPIFCEFDGTFPNHHPDPTVPKNLIYLQEKVRSTGADLGIAFDGDADRIGAVSATGQILFGDQLVLYFSRDILAEVPGATIISEVKSSKVLFDTLAKWGAKPIIWKTGHSLIKAKLKETGAALAGEMSGHMFFAHRFFGFDDALYAGARLIEGLSLRNETLDEFLASLPPAINTPELRIDYPDSKKFELVSEFVARAKSRFGNQVLDIDGARISFPRGWGLLRASNTQPVLVMRFEGEDQKSLEEVSLQFASILKDIDPSIEIPKV